MYVDDFAHQILCRIHAQGLVLAQRRPVRSCEANVVAQQQGAGSKTTVEVRQKMFHLLRPSEQILSSSA